MSAWATVDAWRESHRPRPREEARVDERAQRATTKRSLNLLRRFRDVPPELVQAIYAQAYSACIVSDGVFAGSLAGLGAAQVAMDWLDEQKLGPGAPPRWRRMCSAELQLILQLPTIRTQNWYLKRLRTALIDQSTTAEKFRRCMITDAQSVQLRAMIRKHRRQMATWVSMRPELRAWLLAVVASKRKPMADHPQVGRAW